MADRDEVELTVATDEDAARTGLRRSSSEEAEAADLVVCMPLLNGVAPGAWAERFGFCAWCGVPIRWAASSPEKPEKVCVPCVAALLKGKVEEAG